MTKAQMQAQIAELTARVQGRPAATALPGWIVDAKTATARPTTAPAIATAPSAPKTPRPLQSVVEIQSGISKQDGQPYAFPVLNIHNGVNGKFHRGVRLDSRYLAAVVAWLRTPAGQTFQQTSTLQVG